MGAVLVVQQHLIANDTFGRSALLISSVQNSKASVQFPERSVYSML